MIVYTVLGSAPVYMGQCVYDAGVEVGLVSFYDVPKAFTSLPQLDQRILEKLDERQHNRPEDPAEPGNDVASGPGLGGLHPGSDSHLL